MAVSRVVRAKGIADSPTSSGRTKSSAGHVQKSAGPEAAVITAFDWSYDTIHDGIRAETVKALVQADVLDRRDVHMVIAERTLERRIGLDQPLKIEEADAIARLVRTVTQARAVFEEVGRADEWLRSPNPALGNHVPMEMARTDAGGREVEAVLGRIAHGIFH